MKIYFILSLGLLLSLSRALSLVPTANSTLVSTVLNSPEQYYANGTYYFGTSALNITSGVVTNIQIPIQCSSIIYFTNDVVPYCYKSEYDNKGQINEIYLLLLNSDITKVTAEYKITDFNAQDDIKIINTDKYILFEFTDTNEDYYNFSVYPFDLETKSVVCPKYNLQTKAGFESAYTNGDIFLYSYITQNNIAYFVMESCSNSKNVTTKGPNEYSEINLFAFNSSEIFVNFFQTLKNDTANYFIEPALLNSSGMLSFGSAMNVNFFTKYNDTHMFLSFLKGGIQTFGLFVINSNLEFIEIHSFNFGIDAPVSAYPVYGTSEVSLVLGENVAFVTYDFNSSKIVQNGTTSNSIFLSKGSIVSTNQNGYFIQSPGEPFFIQAPFSNVLFHAYHDPTDYNQTYTLFVPSATYNYSNTCLLTHFNSSSSVITQTTFPNCPLSLSTGNPIQIKDVKFASDGTPHVCYRDAYGSIFIVNTAGSLGPYQSSYFYSSIQNSLN